MSEAIWIELSYNQLTGTIPESLLQPTTYALNLLGVKMSHNRLTGNIPLDSTKEYNYYAIDLSYNDLSGSIIPSSICSNGGTLLNSLSLQNNSLSEDIVDFLVECHAYVWDMLLANNSFSGDLSRLVTVSSPGNSTTARLSNPRVLDLSNNNLQISTTEANRDPMKAVLELLVLNTSLTSFKIPRNNFSIVSLPSYFPFAAESLQVLDLSGNHLIGEISSAAFNSTWLPALQSLSLADNDLIGPIPEALVLILNLTVLNLTDNSLFGPLPRQLPNALYNPSFYEGNDGLCRARLHSCSEGDGVQWWVLLLVVGGSVITLLGNCLVVIWRFKVYREMHQDADLIKTLLERESASLMSLRELSKATNNFAESLQIAAGGFGVVYTGRLNDGTIVAIKRSKHEGSEKDVKDRFLNEVRILSPVNHRRLAKLLGYCMENKVTLLVFAFVLNGTLQEHLQGKNIGVARLSWRQRLHIPIQTADALNYMHSGTTYPIYHRDVKSANILSDEDLNAKVADFGISKLAPPKVTHVSTLAIQGTIRYIDPDFYTSYQLTEKSGVYSFGVVLLELSSAAIDFERGGDQTGLVNFASLYIESGDLRPVMEM